MKLPKDYQCRASAGYPPEAAARGVVVVYMDRARRATVDIFAQTLPVTLPKRTKMASLSNRAMADVAALEHKRTTHDAICWLSLL